MAQKLGQVAVGTVVKINERGSPVNYLVVHQGLPSSMYDASCDGTWVLRQDIYENAVWDADNSNVLPGADIFTTMAGMLSLYDPFIRDAIKTVKIPYCLGGGSSTVKSGINGLECKIFPLSGYEVGFTTSVNSYFPVDGAKLDYFESGETASANQKRIAKKNNNAVGWFLRSQSARNTYHVFGVGQLGSSTSFSAKNVYGVWNAFVLSQSIYVLDDGTIIQPPPSSITTSPSATMQGQPISVSWSAVDGADSYVLQRKADGGEWEQVYAGAEISYTDTAGSWGTIQYQVCGVFGGVNGAFAISTTIQVLPASALSIGGTDGDLGALTSDVPYSVATNTGKNVTMDLAVNGVNVFHRADATTYTGTLSVLDLPTGMGSIVIAASVQADSGMVTAERKWTYTKPAQPFPASGGVAALTKDGKPLFPQTLAECVRTIGGPWGGDLSKALDRLAKAAVFHRETTPQYTEVKVDLSKAKAGDIVNLPVNGVMVPHIVVQVGNPDPAIYDASCDGVWLLRKDIVEEGPWNSSDVNTLAGSTIMTKMQTYVADYDSTVQAAIKTVKIPYCVGANDNTVKTLADGLSCKMFPLSAQEIGCGDYPNLLNDGVKLDYFLFGYVDSAAQKLRIAKYNGRNGDWSLRTPYNFNENVWKINAPGGFTLDAPNEQNGYLPCFLLPTTFTATYYVDDAGAVHPEQEYTNGGDFYDLWGEVIPTVKIEIGSYVGTGTTGASNPNILTFLGKPLVVMVMRQDNADTCLMAPMIYGCSETTISSTNTTRNTLNLIWEDNSVKYWSPYVSEQHNTGGKTYIYFGIYQ